MLIPIETIILWVETFASHQQTAHQANKSQDQTLGICFHAAFDYDALRPRSTAQNWKNKKLDLRKSRHSKYDENLI